MDNHAFWLVCRKGKYIYLLAQDSSSYYIIQIGKKRDYDMESWLAQQGATKSLLKELNLKFERIPKKDLRGMGIGGYKTGYAIHLLLKSGIRKLILETDYEEAWIKEFFEGVPHLAVPKRRTYSNWKWREEKQNPELFHKLRFLVPICMTFGLCVTIAYVLTEHCFWFTLSLLCIALQLGLAIGMPAYFTIVLPEKSRNKNVWCFDLPLFSVIILILLKSRMNWQTYDKLGSILCIGAVAGVLIYWRIRDLHEMKWGLLSTVFVGAAVFLILAGQVNEVYDVHPEESYILEVVDLRVSRGRSIRNRSVGFYCTVVLPNGDQEELSISPILYYSLDEGDYVRVEHGVGVLGIEYINAYSLE